MRQVLAGFRSLRPRAPFLPARVQLAGGEPLLAPRLFEILSLIRGEGLPVRILTNGTLVGAAEARALAAAGVAIVQVSLDGLEETHDRLRGPGAFGRALAGLRHLRAAGVSTTVAMCLSSANLADLDGVMALAAREADRFGFSRFVPCGRGGDRAATVLPAARLAEAFGAVQAAAGRFPGLGLPRRDPLWNVFVGQRCPSPYAAGCSAGQSGICVEADGTVYPCRRLPLPLGNAYETSLADLWDHPLMVRLRDRDRLRGRCGRCLIRWRCGGCRGVALAVTGDPFGADPQCFDRPTLLENVARAARSLVEAWNPPLAGGG